MNLTSSPLPVVPALLTMAAAQLTAQISDVDVQFEDLSDLTCDNYAMFYSTAGSSSRYLDRDIDFDTFEWLSGPGEQFRGGPVIGIAINPQTGEVFLEQQSPVSQTTLTTQLNRPVGYNIVSYKLTSPGTDQPYFSSDPGSIIPGRSYEIGLGLPVEFKTMPNTNHSLSNGTIIEVDPAPGGEPGIGETPIEYGVDLGPGNSIDERQFFPIDPDCPQGFLNDFGLQPRYPGFTVGRTGEISLGTPYVGPLLNIDRGAIRLEVELIMPSGVSYFENDGDFTLNTLGRHLRLVIQDPDAVRIIEPEVSIEPEYPPFEDKSYEQLIRPATPIIGADNPFDPGDGTIGSISMPTGANFNQRPLQPLSVVLENAAPVQADVQTREEPFPEFIDIGDFGVAVWDGSAMTPIFRSGRPAPAGFRSGGPYTGGFVESVNIVGFFDDGVILSFNVRFPNAPFPSVFSWSEQDFDTALFLWTVSGGLEPIAFELDFDFGVGGVFRTFGVDQENVQPNGDFIFTGQIIGTPAGTVTGVYEYDRSAGSFSFVGQQNESFGAFQLSDPDEVAVFGEFPIPEQPNPDEPRLIPGTNLEALPQNGFRFVDVNPDTGVLVAGGRVTELEPLADPDNAINDAVLTYDGTDWTVVVTDNDTDIFPAALPELPFGSVWLPSRGLTVDEQSRLSSLAAVLLDEPIGVGPTTRFPLPGEGFEYAPLYTVSLWLIDDLANTPQPRLVVKTADTLPNGQPVQALGSPQSRGAGIFAIQNDSFFAGSAEGPLDDDLNIVYFRRGIEDTDYFTDGYGFTPTPYVLRPEGTVRTPPTEQGMFRVNGNSFYTPNLVFRGAGDNMSWDDRLNWTLGRTPDFVHDVYIFRDSSSVNVVGPSADTTVESLTISGSNAGRLTLQPDVELKILDDLVMTEAGVLAFQGPNPGTIAVEGGASLAGTLDVTCLDGLPGDTVVIGMVVGTIDGAFGRVLGGTLDTAGGTLTVTLDDFPDLNRDGFVDELDIVAALASLDPTLAPSFAIADFFDYSVVSEAADKTLR